MNNKESSAFIKAARIAWPTISDSLWHWVVKHFNRKITEPIGDKPKRDRARYMREIYRPKVQKLLDKARKAEGK